MSKHQLADEERAVWDATPLSDYIIKINKKALDENPDQNIISLLLDEMRRMERLREMARREVAIYKRNDQPYYRNLPETIKETIYESLLFVDGPLSKALSNLTREIPKMVKKSVNIAIPRHQIRNPKPNPNKKQPSEFYDKATLEIVHDSLQDEAIQRNKKYPRWIRSLLEEWIEDGAE